MVISMSLRRPQPAGRGVRAPRKSRALYLEYLEDRTLLSYYAFHQPLWTSLYSPFTPAVHEASAQTYTQQTAASWTDASRYADSSPAASNQVSSYAGYASTETTSQAMTDPVSATS